MSAEVLEVQGINLLAIAPEAVVAFGGLVVLILGAGFRRASHGALSALSLIVLAGAAAAAIPGAGRSELAFGDTVALDGFATFLKFVFLAAAALTVLASRRFLADEEAPPTEYLGLVLLGTTGMMLMASAADLIVVFLALETFSLALYVLAAFRRGRLDSLEAALKYFLMGSFASAFFLFGVALTYGGTGSTRLTRIASFLAGTGESGPLVVAGLALVIAGLAFKVAAVPFHMWTPDAYQGSPAPVAGFMAAGSKAAGFAVLLRGLIAGFGDLTPDWRPALAAIALATMVLGGLVAVAQTNIKRMLAYSAIAHTGFLLTAVVAANPRGVSGALYYLAVYGVTIVGAFAAVYSVGGPGEERGSLSSYRGLAVRQPFVAATFALMLVSLAGVPPSAGFWAKFEVFSAAAEAGQMHLVVTGVLTSAVAAFFYLRVIVMMFLEEGESLQAPEPTPPSIGLALGIASLVVMMGIYPAPLLEAARAATFVFG